MKFGIILNTNAPEKVWNAFRFANTSLEMGHGVQIFLMSAGVESEFIIDECYDIAALIKSFKASKGVLYACGTCLQSRKLEAQTTSHIATMIDCVELVAAADKVIVF